MFTHAARVGLLAVLAAAVVLTATWGEAEAPHAKPVNPSELRRVAWLRTSKPYPDEAGPIGTEIRDLAVGPTGSLWVATSEGLSRLADGQFSHCKRKGGLPDDDVLALASLDGGVVAATRKGLVWLDDPSPKSSLTPERLGDSEHVTSVFALGDRLWFVDSASGVPSIKSFLIGKNGKPDSTIAKSHTWDRRIKRLLPSGPGQILCEFSPDEWHELNVRNGALDGAKAPLAPIASLTVGSRVVLLGADADQKQRLLVIGTESHIEVSGEDFGSGPCCLGLGREKNDRLWLGRKGSIREIDIRGNLPKLVRSFALPDGVAPTAVVEDFVGRLWVGTAAGLLMADPDRSWVAHAAPRSPARASEPNASDVPFLPENTTSVAHRPPVAFSPDGRVWVASDNVLRVLSSNGDVQSETTSPSFARIIAASLGTGKDPDYLMTERAVYQGREGKWEKRTSVQNSGDLLAALGGEVVIRSGGSDELPEFRLLAGSPSEPVPSPLIPGGIVSAALDRDREVVGVGRQALVALDEKLEVRALPLPREPWAPRLPGELILDSYGRLHLVTPHDVWVRSKQRPAMQGTPIADHDRLEWDRLLATADEDALSLGEYRLPRVLALLPETDGALVGLKSSGEVGGDDISEKGLLFRTLDTGPTTPKRLPVTGGWVGGAGGALRRNRNKALWVGTAANLFVQTAPNKEFEPAFMHENQKERSWVLYLLEDSQGRMWAAGQTRRERDGSGREVEGQVWIFEKDRTSRRLELDLTKKLPFVLSLQRGTAEVWIGGVDLLTAVDGGRATH